MNILLFYPLSALIIILSLGVILATNPVHSALLLVGAMVAIAGVFLCLNCEFLAMLQIFIYAGAIMVLFLFIVTTIDTRKDEKFVSSAKFSQASGILLSGSMFFLFFFLALQFVQHLPDTGRWLGDAKGLGELFLKSYSLPFEVVTLVLLTAMAGVIVMSHDPLYRRRSKEASKQILSGGNKA
ncbi:MAG: NADH-quinone oxidoreductase subunit J [Candidatus Riflebacteria bacterium]|nr:NADH-quinone oxidoreductase subunit J [Candidatus Riflebacteria bacterium]